MSLRPLAWIAGLTVGVAVIGIAVIAIFIGTGVSDADPNAGRPRIGEDHWHATYTITVCGVLQPNAPTWEGSGVHTHADGVIHTHPFTASEEGDGARLVKWFEYGGGVLSEDELRVPGQTQTFRDGDVCPAGEPGSIQVLANGVPADIPTYIPKDGDMVEITFGAAP